MNGILNARTQFQTFFAIVALAFFYYLAAKLVLPLSAPPSNASAFWPSAGIALAFSIKFGRKVLPGVFLGSLLKNIEFYDANSVISSSEPIVLFLLIPTIATLLTYSGLKLIHKFARYPDPLISELNILKVLLLGGPVAALVPSGLSTIALISADIMPASNFVFSSFTWWLGDSLGVIIVTPLLLLFFDLPGKINPRRKWVVLLSVTTSFSLAVLLFQNSVHTENKRLETILQNQAFVVGSDIRHEINTDIDFIQYMRDTRFINDSISLENFNHSADAIRKTHPNIHAIALDLIVKHADKENFERDMQIIHQREYKIRARENGDELKWLPIEDKPEYAAVTYYSPSKYSDSALGYDPTSDPELARFFYQARDTGQATLTNSLRLPRLGAKDRSGIISYVPLYKQGAPLNTTEQRRTAFIGNLTSIYHFETTISAVLQRLDFPSLILSITDISTASREKQLYSTISGKITDNEFTVYHTISIANQVWKIAITPPSSYFKNNYSKNVWVILFVGMLFTAILTMMLMISTGRRARIEEIVSKRTESLHKVQENLRLLAVTFESHEAIMISDENNDILRVNKAFTEITGFTEEDVLGKNPHILSSGKHPLTFYQSMWQQLIEDGKFEDEMWNRRKDGTIYPERRTISTVNDASGKIINYVSVFSDITEQKANEQQIKDLAFYDPLTNLPNRRLLLDRLSYKLSLSQRTHNHGILIFLDLDDFKKINDSLGHEIGDELLQKVAERLQKTVRESDTVARLGGDEFVILIANETHEEIEYESLIDFASMLAEKIIDAFKLPFKLKTYSHYITTSIGITIFPPTETSALSILRQADTAMYKAKKLGKNSFCFYEEEMQVIAEAVLALEHDLRQAIKRNEFSLHYQPQLNQSGKMISAEALLRWQHPTRGGVSPADFIPLAEESGLIIPIGQWVLVMACSQLQLWLEHDVDIQHISINVSPKQFRQNDFITQVQSALAQSGLAPEKLMLEITEGIVLDNIDDTIKKMDILKKMGIQFSVDDFGTGYSSLSYLKRLPIDELKIDQSFVSDITTDKDDAEIVTTIIAMASHLKLMVVAEGVENSQQLEFLIKNGCSLFQGYHFSKPLSASDLLSFVKHNDI